jgi:hypothetical protein
VRVREFSLPRAAIPRVLRQLRRGGGVPEGLAEDALPLRLPPGVGDVRVARGRVVLYQEPQ